MPAPRPLKVRAYAVALSDMIGATKAAKYVGISTRTMHTWRRELKTDPELRTAVEKLCGDVWRLMEQEMAVMLLASLRALRRAAEAVIDSDDPSPDLVREVRLARSEVVESNLTADIVRERMASLPDSRWQERLPGMMLDASAQLEAGDNAGAEDDSETCGICLGLDEDLE